MVSSVFVSVLVSSVLDSVVPPPSDEEPPLEELPSDDELLDEDELLDDEVLDEVDPPLAGGGDVLPLDGGGVTGGVGTDVAA